MTDNDEWENIMNEEENPYDNPDTTFENEDNAFKAGITLALENENGDAIDLDNDINYPSFTEKKVIKAFKVGYKKGTEFRNNRDYGDSDEEEVNISTLVYLGSGDDEETKKDNYDED